MKRIALSAAVMFSAIMPFATAHAAPVTAAAKQSYVEHVAVIITRDGVYDVYEVTDLGGGWY